MIDKDEYDRLVITGNEFSIMYYEPNATLTEALYRYVTAWDHVYHMGRRSKK